MRFFLKKLPFHIEKWHFFKFHNYIRRYLPAKFEVIWLDEEPTD